MSAQDGSRPDHGGDGLLPSEAAKILGVTTATVAAWARSGRLPFTVTLGGHRRYRWADIQTLFKGVDPEQEIFEEDAARLYDQGWSAT